MKRLIPLLLLVLTHQISFAQSYFAARTQAEYAADANNFKRSVELYRQSFQLHAENSKDFYQAARVASQAHDARQAYLWLHDAVRLGFRGIEKLQSDTKFEWLRKNRNWQSFYATLSKTIQRENEKYNPTLQKQLLEIWDADQKIRSEYGVVLRKYGRNTPQLDEVAERMNAIDKKNLIRIREIIAKYGWVTPEVVGSVASNTLFIVIQHSDLEVQKEFLPIFRDAIRNPLVDKTLLCLLEDRIALDEGKKQLYGTQSSYKNGQFEMDEIEDPENLEERRARAGCSD